MDFGSIVLAVVEVNAIIVIFVLIREERDPSTTLAWAFALLLIPGVGLVAYLLFGTNRRAIGKRDRLRREGMTRGAAAVEHLYDAHDEAAIIELGAQPAIVARISEAVERQCGTRLLPCEDLRIYTHGEAKFRQLLDDIDSARQSIHLQYFIWEHDELTQRICDLLARKVAEGVEVRVLYDWAGSAFHRKTQLRGLAAAGAQVLTDRPRLLSLNYRDHRKIAVIDGRIGYTGGMNMGKEYVDGGMRFDAWRDTHCRFVGPLVAELQRVFASRWYRISREELFGSRYFPDLRISGDRPVWGQLAFSGPESQWQAVRNSFLLCINGAERSLRIQSPYFVPDEAIMESLVVQSLAGIDVRFMMAGVPDKRIPWYAAFSYIDELIAAGGRMLQYAAGFFHPKVITVDGRIAVVGTTNFDIRSFSLHDELSLFFYDIPTARELDDIFDRDERRCIEIDAAFYDRMPRPARMRNAFMRLWSRLL